MRIDPSFQYLGNTGSDVSNVKDQTKVTPQNTNSTSASDSNVAESGDTVQLSSAATEAQQLQAQLAQTPDVRSDRVAALQQQIQQGTYKPSDEQIASAMLNDLLGPTSGS